MFLRAENEELGMPNNYRVVKASTPINCRNICLESDTLIAGKSTGRPALKP
jgi:hypothetical protein